MGEGQRHPPQVQATAVPVTHTSEDIGLGDGVAQPGLFQLTSYFQRFGNRCHLASWLWGAGQVQSGAPAQWAGGSGGDP